MYWNAAAGVQGQGLSVVLPIYTYKVPLTLQLWGSLRLAPIIIDIILNLKYCNLIGQLQVSKSHRKPVRKTYTCTCIQLGYIHRNIIKSSVDILEQLVNCREGKVSIFTLLSVFSWFKMSERTIT